MLYDELIARLKAAGEELSHITQYWENSFNEKRITELEERAHKPDFWQDPHQAAVLQELQALKNLRATYKDITTTYEDTQELVELFADSEEELARLAKTIDELEKKIHACKVDVFLSGPYDANSCFMSINAGAGGTESQDWAAMLLRMYTRFCEEQKLSHRLVDYQAGEAAGIKSATLAISKGRAYGLLKSEHGIHRLVRTSPFDAQKRRHTSFASVFVIPEIQHSPIEINTHDLRIDTYRASGAGGQHVNTTDSAVRITHIPSGIVVQCQSERSQLQNKETALKVLRARLAQKQREEEEREQKAVEKRQIAWGSQIRSYVLHPYKMVKDHRTGHESPRPENVLDGELMPFIESYLQMQADT